MLSLITRLAILLPVIALAPGSNLTAGPATPPVTGEPAPGMTAIDSMMVRFLTDHRLTGASLAIARRGRLVYARGFGLANRETGQAVRPDMLFRVGSLSKPITAIAILKLMEGGRLGLSDRMLDRLPVKGVSGDPRLREITIEHLLRHRAGWDRETTVDPMGQSQSIARKLGVPAPASPRDILRYMLPQPLQFKPGARFAYSNFGYSVLGRVIEHVSDRPYDEFVKREILLPLGIEDMHIGRGPEEEMRPNEVRYYTPDNRRRRAWFGPKKGTEVPVAYALPVHVYDSHGGWIASAPALARFLTLLDAKPPVSILAPGTVAQLSTPAPGERGATYYGLGFSARKRKQGGYNLFHTGAIAQCCTAMMAHLHADDLVWVVLFNMYEVPGGKSPTKVFEKPFYAALDSVRTWPDQDLFGSFLKKGAAAEPAVDGQCLKRCYDEHRTAAVDWSYVEDSCRRRCRK